MVGWSDGPSFRSPFFQTQKMSRFLYKNHRCGLTLTLLNVLGVLGVLNVLNVLNMPLDVSFGLMGQVATRRAVRSVQCF